MPNLGRHAMESALQDKNLGRHEPACLIGCAGSVGLSLKTENEVIGFDIFGLDLVFATFGLGLADWSCRTRTNRGIVLMI